MALIPLNRGSDLRATVVWSDEAGPINLTGYTVALFEASAELSARLSVGFGNRAAGEVTLTMNWSDEFLTGQGLNFRIRLTSASGIKMTPDPIALDIK